MAANTFTLINQTNENILLAFITESTGPDIYAWKVVAPSQRIPFVEDIPDLVEIVVNYNNGQNGTDPYSGQQTAPVWWDNVKRNPVAYQTRWNSNNNTVEMTEVTSTSPADIAIENLTNDLQFIHLKFGSNEYTPPINLLPYQQVFYTLPWPISVAVVESYSQYSPPNGELYVVKNVLSPLKTMQANQTATITGNKANGYGIVVV